MAEKTDSYVAGGQWYNTKPEDLNKETPEWGAELLGRGLPTAIALANIGWNTAMYKRLRDQKLKHRTKPYEEAYTHIRPVQKYPTDVKAAYLQDIASMLRPKFHTSDAQLTMAGLQGAQAQQARAVGELAKTESNFVMTDKARFADEYQKQQLRNIEIRNKNIEIGREDQAFRERAQLTFLENIQKTGTDALNQAQQAVHTENLYNATASNTQHQNAFNVLKDELDTAEWKLAQSGGTDIVLKGEIKELRDRLYALTNQGPPTTGNIRSGFLTGRVPRYNLVQRP